MTSLISDLPICKLSCQGGWTPLNRIFFSQCIQDSDEERNFHSQKKKKWKRKKDPFKKGSTYRKYIVYESASSSESEVSTFDEFNWAGYHQRNRKKIISDKPNRNLVEEFDVPHYERRVNIDDDKFCSEPEVHIYDEHDSADEEKGKVKIGDHKSSSEPKIFLEEPDISDEFNSADEEERRVEIDDDKSCSKPKVFPEEPDISYEPNSADEGEGRVKIDDDKSCDKSCSEPKVFPEEPDISDDINSTDEEENNLHLKQSAVKYKKYTTNKNESSNEYEMRSDTSDDSYNSSDSSDDYEVARKKIKNQKSKSPQLSEYEKQVQKNRDEKVALMKALKLIEAKENFQEAIKTLKLKTGQKKQSNKRKIFQDLKNSSIEEVDRRIKTSSHKEIVKVRRQSSRRKKLMEKKEEIFASQLCDKLPSFLSFEEALKKDHVYHDFISESSGSECKIPHLIDSDYASHFEKMALQESQLISCSAITSMVVHESQEKIIICAGNANGEIIFWHVNSDYDFCAFQLHLQRVSCLKFNPYSPNVLTSSSVDGTMYHGDFEKKMFYQMFRAENCNYFDFLSPKSYLVAHGIGYASIVDIRTHSKTFEKRHKCNEDAIKTLSLHPVNKYYFTSSHQKGSVRLWDLRKLQNEPLIEVTFEGDNLMSSFFSPVTGNSVLVTMSDTICLLDSSSLGKEFKLKNSIQHENLSNRFQATWLPNTDDAFVIGSRLNPRRIEILDDKLCYVFNFTDERFKVITPVNVFHSSLPFLASASRRSIFIFSESE